MADNDDFAYPFHVDDYHFQEQHPLQQEIPELLPTVSVRSIKYLCFVFSPRIFHKLAAFWAPHY